MPGVLQGSPARTPKIKPRQNEQLPVLPWLFRVEWGMPLFDFFEVDVGAFVLPYFLFPPAMGTARLVRGVSPIARFGAVRAAYGAPYASDGSHEEGKNDEDEGKKTTEGFHFLVLYLDDAS